MQQQRHQVRSAPLRPARTPAKAPRVSFSGQLVNHATLVFLGLMAVVALLLMADHFAPGALVSVAQRVGIPLVLVPAGSSVPVQPTAAISIRSDAPPADVPIVPAPVVADMLPGPALDASDPRCTGATGTIDPGCGLSAAQMREALDGVDEPPPQPPVERASLKAAPAAVGEQAAPPTPAPHGGKAKPAPHGGKAKP